MLFLSENIPRGSGGVKPPASVAIPRPCDHIGAQTEQPEGAPRMVYLDFEKPLAEIEGKAEELRTLARSNAEMDVSKEAFPFMTWIDGTLGGFPVRAYRISFSGELSYEIAVPAALGKAFWEALGSKIDEMDPGHHDKVLAIVSHLPHIIAYSLVNLVKSCDDCEGTMKTIAAGGFKDITRIASSSPTMWEHICAQNQSNISQILGNYIETLNEAKKLVDAGDSQGIYDMFDHSRNYRNSMPNGSAGPIKRAFEIYCDIPDEAGVIATIATILASNALSIKNIGIVHNREFEEGVLRIEFYDSISCEKAVALLQKHRYIVYER